MEITYTSLQPLTQEPGTSTLEKHPGADADAERGGPGGPALESVGGWSLGCGGGGG